MIENLDGIRETINYKPNTQIRLYNNVSADNYPPHWHTAFEIIMPVVNSYKVICDKKLYELCESDILIISPGCVHEIFAPSSGYRIIFQIFLEITSQIRELESILGKLFPVTLITANTYRETHTLLNNLILEIEKEYSANTPLSNISIYQMFLEFLIILGKEYILTLPQVYADLPKQRAYIERFSYICNYITMHCTEDLSLENIASEAGFSKYHFTRLFKQFMNISFYKYLNQKRMTVAFNLLLDTELSVTEVALRSGYQSMTAFIRMFKLMYHCTPTEFRRMHYGD